MMSEGRRLGQSGTRRGQGEEMGGEAGGDGDIYTNRSCSPWNARDAPASPAHLQLSAEGGPQAILSTSSHCSLQARGRLLRAPTTAGLLFMLSAGRKSARNNLVLGN